MEKGIRQKGQVVPAELFLQRLGHAGHRDFDLTQILREVVTVKLRGQLTLTSTRAFVSRSALQLAVTSLKRVTADSDAKMQEKRRKVPATGFQGQQAPSQTINPEAQTTGAEGY